jgi:carbamoyl-phosphate synthase large subunit
VFLSLADRDKAAGLIAARRFAELGFSIAATAGTATMLEANSVPVDTIVAKVGEEVGVDAVDLISSGKVDLVVNTPRGRGPRADGMHIRRSAIAHSVACVTTVAAAIAAAAGIAEEVQQEPDVRSLQEYHADGQLRLEV